MVESHSSLTARLRERAEPMHLEGVEPSSLLCKSKVVPLDHRCVRAPGRIRTASLLRVREASFRIDHWRVDGRRSRTPTALSTESQSARFSNSVCRRVGLLGLEPKNAVFSCRRVDLRDACFNGATGFHPWKLLNDRLETAVLSSYTITPCWWPRQESNLLVSLRRRRSRRLALTVLPRGLADGAGRT